MSWGPHRAECRIGFALVESIDSIESRARREQRRFERSWTRSGVGVETTTAALTELLDGVDVRSVVHTLEFGAGGGPGYERSECLSEVGRVDSGDDRIEPSGPLGVVATGDVIQVARMGGKQHRHDRRGYPSRPKPYAPHA
jgi:hypothetical protein